MNVGSDWRAARSGGAGVVSLVKRTGRHTLDLGPVSLVRGERRRAQTVVFSRAARVWVSVGPDGNRVLS